MRKILKQASLRFTKKFITNNTYKPKLRHVITGLQQHSQGTLPNIAIFNSPRGGSTWLAETLTSARGLACINEPFLPRYDSRQPEHRDFPFECFLSRPRPRLIPSTISEETLLNQYLNDYEGLKKYRQSNPFASNFTLRSTRLLFKLNHVGLIFDHWLKGNQANLQKLFMFRHPAATVLSQHKAFGNDPLDQISTPRELSFLQLTQKEKKHVLTARESHDPFLRLATVWALEHLGIRNALRGKKHDFILTSYEQLVAEPNEFARICGLLQIEYSRKIRVAAGIPSNSTSAERLNSVSPEERLMDWKTKLEPRDLDSIKRTLETFEISFYNMKEPWIATE